MYQIFIVTHPLPLILLPNEKLVQMLSNDIFNDTFKCPTFPSIIPKYYTIFTNIVMVIHVMLYIIIYTCGFVCITYSVKSGLPADNLQ